MRLRQTAYGIQPAINRIERRGLIRDSNDAFVSEVRTTRFQRPYAPSPPPAVPARAGSEVLQMCGDFDPAITAAFAAGIAAARARVSNPQTAG